MKTDAKVEIINQNTKYLGIKSVIPVLIGNNIMY